MTKEMKLSSSTRHQSTVETANASCQSRMPSGHPTRQNSSPTALMHLCRTNSKQSQPCFSSPRNCCKEMTHATHKVDQHMHSLNHFSTSSHHSGSHPSCMDCKLPRVQPRAQQMKSPSMTETLDSQPDQGTPDVKNMCLESLLRDPQCMQFRLNQIPADFQQQHNLKEPADGQGCVRA